MTGLSPVTPLDGIHDLSRFSCGKPEMDDWLRKYALPSHRLAGAKTYVTRQSGSNVVRGYYSLAAASIEFSKVPRRVRKGLGRYPIPAILLARLAVESQYQGKRVGESLLFDALERALGAADVIAARVFLVVALDEDARAFYERYDFERSPVDEFLLMLLMQDIEASVPEVDK